MGNIFWVYTKREKQFLLFSSGALETSIQLLNNFIATASVTISESFFRGVLQKKRVA